MLRRYIALAGLFAGMLSSQTTQGLISGSVTDVAGEPLPKATIRLTRFDPISGVALPSPDQPWVTTSSGYYVRAAISPGTYRLQVRCPDYQSQEVNGIEVAVASRVRADFKLQSLAQVWRSGYQAEIAAGMSGPGAIVQYYAADVESLKSWIIRFVPAETLSRVATLSYVLDANAIGNLPLNGRDLYSGLALEPLVTSSNTTGRGFGLAVNGMRPTSSNFLLDGIENNNYLISGPLAVVAPEAALEYRVSVNNFSAEYGRAAGYIANAVTRAGETRLHGTVYVNLKNDVLNANPFQENRQGIPRRPLKEIQGGASVSGPLAGDRWFFSAAWERLRSRGRLDPTTQNVPDSTWSAYTSRNSTARMLLTEFPPPAGKVFDAPVAQATFEPPVSFDRDLALGRLDYRSTSGGFRAFTRLSVARPSQPDFIWWPYAGFNSKLEQPVTSLAVSAENVVSPRFLNDARFGWSSDRLAWDRPHPEIPTLYVSGDQVLLPGSPAAYAYSNRSRSLEWNDTLTYTRNANTMKLGGGLLDRRIDGALTFGRDGLYSFPGILGFLDDDEPDQLRIAVDRFTLPKLVVPVYDRQYRYTQYHAFIDDSWSPLRRLTISTGLRYENFGAPVIVGSTQDAVVQPGSFKLSPPPGAPQQLYRRDNRNLAVRIGLSYALDSTSDTVLRGAYGIFYDRPFDNFWQTHRNNNYTLATLDYAGEPHAYLPVSGVLPLSQGQPFAADFPTPVLFDPNFRNGYAQQYFLEAQRRLPGKVIVSVGGAGALGRRLLTTDVVNRAGSQNILYRAAQGKSDFHALSAVARWGASRGGFQVSYTWSHSIDNQSDPLAGDFFDLAFTGFVRRTAPGDRYAAFAMEGNSNADRGSSDFDQRHNVVFWAHWTSSRLQGRIRAALLRDWTFSSVGAIRTGFPFSVLATSQYGIIHQRADIANPALLSPEPMSVPGGQRLLNKAAFAEPPAGRLGELGRNAFAGPGLYSLDLSVARSFQLRRLGEGGRLTVRADAYNALNHANLGQPDSVLQSPTFGIAARGRSGRDPDFPAFSPLAESARQIQFLLRIQF